MAESAAGPPPGAMPLGGDRPTLAEVQQAIEDGTLNVRERHPFEYKKRKWTGTWIHIAALDTDGAKHLKKLVELNCDVNEIAENDMSFTEADGRTKRVISKVQPIHLASGSGNVKMIEELCNVVREKAFQEGLREVAEDRVIELLNHKTYQAKSFVGSFTPRESQSPRDEPHYCPIHDAVFFGQRMAVSKLLDLHANPNEVNNTNQTPLHICAKLKKFDSAEVLKKHGADIMAKDKGGETPLMTAILSGIETVQRLKLFVNYSFEELLIAAKEDPSSAVELLKERDMWHKGLTDADRAKKHNYRLPTNEDLVKLIRTAPNVAAEMLDVLTKDPPAPNPWAFPVPRHAPSHIVNTDNRLCLYTQDVVWDKDFGDKKNDQGIGDHFRHNIKKRAEDHDRTAKTKLHKALLQGVWNMVESICEDRRSSETCRVTIKVLHVQRPICPELLDALAGISNELDLGIFNKSATQALLDFTWVWLVRKGYTADVILRSIELFFLFWVAVRPPVDQDHTFKVLWSFLAAMASREAVMELGQLCGHYRTLGTTRPYLTQIWNAVDWATIVCHNYFTWTWQNDTDSVTSRKLLAVISCLRWIQLLYRIGAYRFGRLGFKVVCIFQSFFQIGGIMLITLFLFMAFVHTFAALEKPGEENVADVVLNAFRLLFLGDGDGIDYVLWLGEGTSIANSWLTYVLMFGSAIVFCICVLNLFIAVHSEAYNTVRLREKEFFYLHRTNVCFERMLQPRLPYGNLERPARAYVCLMACGLLVWFALFFVDDLPVTILPFWLLSCMLAGDMVLRKRPWREPMPEWWPPCGSCFSRSRVGPEGEESISDELPVDEKLHMGPGGMDLKCTLRLHKPPPPPHQHDNDSEASGEQPPKLMSSGSITGKSSKPYYLMWCAPVEEAEAAADSSARESGPGSSGNEVQRLLGDMDKRVGHVESSLGTLDNRMRSVDRNLAALVRHLVPDGEAGFSSSLTGNALSLSPQPTFNSEGRRNSNLRPPTPPTPAAQPMDMHPTESTKSVATVRGTPPGAAHGGAISSLRSNGSQAEVMSFGDGGSPSRQRVMSPVSPTMLQASAADGDEFTVAFKIQKNKEPVMLS